jgi:predicted Zn-dependent protease
MKKNAFFSLGKVVRFLCFFALYHPSLTHSAPSIKADSIILDAQIEDFFDEWAKKLQDAVKYPAKAKIFILYNDQINAFATIDNTIVVHTGLFHKAKNIEQLLVVLAHEFGHVSGGHITHAMIRGRSTGVPIMAMALAGMIAGTVSGNPTAGMAALSFGMNAMERSMLTFSRQQEISADTTCLKILKHLGIDMHYAVDVMTLLSTISHITGQEYEHTHPDIQKRLELFKNQPKVTTPSSITPEDKKKFLIIQAKLKGYLATSPNQVQGMYPKKDDPIGIFAYIMHAYRHSHYTEALKMIHTINDKDPYTLSLEAELNFYQGHYAQAKNLFEKALQKIPHNTMVRLGYATVLLESNEKKDVDKVLGIVKKMIDQEPDHVLAWRLYYKAAGKKGDQQETAYCRGQLYWFDQDKINAKKFAQRAEKGSDPIIKQKARDLLTQIEHETDRGR